MVSKVRGAQAAQGSPLQSLFKVRAKDGPSLSVDGIMRFTSDFSSLPSFPDLLGHFNVLPCIFSLCPGRCGVGRSQSS